MKTKKKTRPRKSAYDCPVCGNETLCGGYCGDACRDAARHSGFGAVAEKLADWQPLELVASRHMPVVMPYKNKYGTISWRDNGVLNIWREPASFRRRVHKLVDS